MRHVTKVSLGRSYLPSSCSDNSSLYSVPTELISNYHKLPIFFNRWMTSITEFVITAEHQPVTLMYKVLVCFRHDFALSSCLGIGCGFNSGDDSTYFHPCPADHWFVKKAQVPVPSRDAPLDLTSTQDFSKTSILSLGSVPFGHKFVSFTLPVVPKIIAK